MVSTADWTTSGIEPVRIRAFKNILSSQLINTQVQVQIRHALCLSKTANMNAKNFEKFLSGVIDDH